MNLFTQTVDSALWSSRAYDDAAHDLPHPEPALPAVVRLSAACPSTLVLLAPPLSTALASSHFHVAPPEIGDIDGTPISLAGSNAAVVSAPDNITDADACAWARALLSTLKPSRVAVLTALPSFRFGGSETNQTAVLGSAKPGLSLVPLQAPAMLEGISAAVVSEAAMLKGVEVVAYVEALEAAGYGRDTLERLSAVLDAETEVHTEEIELRQRGIRHMNAVKQASVKAKTNSIYT